MSCFKWLKINIITNKIKQNFQDINNFDYEDTRTSLMGMDDMDSSNILLNFTDEHMILHDGEEITNKNDKQLRDSMLVLTYLVLSVCYMKEANFKEALECIEDAKKLNERNSLIYFRRSQVKACNLCSGYSDLKEAKEDIEKAIYLNQLEEKSEQKIYVEMAHFVENRLKACKEKIKKNMEGDLFIVYKSICFLFFICFCRNLRKIQNSLSKRW